MRSGLSTIHQTLTGEASAVLSQSISAASLRRHPQTTPLHVASALLSPASSPLRLACLRSHPSHPLRFRALELCFSVALDRLSPSPAPSPSPPLSNALVAALKRAQAHQRRSSPDHLHQPLLSVKVDLLHLILSILDDPSVSRVMREASFSSPAVKSALTSDHQEPPKPRAAGDPPRQDPPAADPRRQEPAGPIGGGPIREDEVKKVLDVLDRSKKRNPVLVGDADPGALLREIIRRLRDRPGIEIVSPARELEENRSDAARRIRELGESIESRGADGDVVVDLGDLRWLVEAAPGGAQQLVSEAGRAAVAEMGRLVRRFDGGKRKVWVVGTASCATYLRCQVYHPAMEADWDLQAVPIAPRAAPTTGLFSSATRGAGILSSSVESLAPSRSFPPIVPMAVAASSEHQPLDRKNMCLICASGFEKELAKLTAERSSNSNPLPQWLQAAKGDVPNRNQSKEQEMEWNKRKEELLERWRQTCSRLHPNASLAAPPPVRVLCQAPRSQVATELALGPSLQPSPMIRAVDPGGCTLDLLSSQEKVDNPVVGDKGDDEFKRLYRGLMERVAWQADASAAVASAVAACRSGRGTRQRIGGARNDMWLLLGGPDKVGKRKMAAALSELVFGDGDHVVCLSLAGGEDGESDARYWGKVAIDRVAEAARRNPFAVFVLEDVDRADSMVQVSIRRAVERGRLPDSHGREVSLGSAILILTSTDSSAVEDERRLEATARIGWQLELVVETRAAKRRPEWLKSEEERQTRQRRDVDGGGLSLDLNLAVGVPEDEGGDNSRNSSDVTVELGRAHDHRPRLAVATLARPLPPELVAVLDATVVFKPVDFSPLRRKVADAVRGKFESVLGRERAIEIEDEAVDRVVAGVWFGDEAAGAGRFEDWVERVVGQSFWQLKNRGLAEDDGSSAVKLVDVKDVGRSAAEAGPAGLPDQIAIVNKC